MHGHKQELRLNGRKADPLVIVGAEPLTEDKLALLAEERGSKPATLKKLSGKHHALARMIATGVKPGDASVMCGYTPSRVSILQDDPMFQNLVAHYTEGVETQYLGMEKKLAILGEDAVDVIHERLAEDPEQFSIDEVLKIAQFGADRSGFGASQKTEVNVKVGIAARMEAANRRLEEMRDVTPPEAG